MGSMEEYMSNIRVSISYGFTPDNRYYLETVPSSIQLALYKYKIYKENRNFILKTIKDNNITIRAVHLPLDTMKTHDKDIYKMMNEIINVSGCDNFVVHPNRGIEQFLSYISKWINPKCICVETFAWRSKKIFRTPLEIIDMCNEYKRNMLNNIWMTLDTSHLEDIWFDHRIMAHLLKYTKVIHLSNKAKGIGQHIPFNDPRGDLNLIAYVRDLKYRYKWSGDIILEYMPEHQHKLIKNSRYIKRLLGGK